MVPPAQTIEFARVVSGILLPVVSIFSLYAMNRRFLLGEYTNGSIANALGAIGTRIVVWPGVRTPPSVAGVL